MPLDGAVAISLFVAIVLFTLAATLLLSGRRTFEGLLLVAFMTLVGTNFLIGGFRFLAGPAPLSWFVAASLTNIWDPVLLVAFTATYPYRRRTGGARWSLALVIGLAMAATLLLLARAPVASVQFLPAGGVGSWEVFVASGPLAVGYTAAWVLAVRGACDAPTRLLQDRAKWALLAVGVATVPRVGLLHVDVLLADGLAAALSSGAPSWIAPHAEGLAVVGVAIPLTAIVFLLGVWVARRAADRGALRVGSTLTAIAWTSAGLLGVAAAASLLEVSSGFNFGATAAYGFRWVAFSAILVHGILAYEVVEFRRTALRALPVAGAVMGAAGAFLLAALALDSASPSTRLAMGLAVGLGAAVPSGWMTRVAIERVDAPLEGRGVAERRLVLYRASLEGEWARGPPDEEGRRRLDRDRRAFGVSVDEARTLEHVVADAVADPAPGLRGGDEITPGLVVERVLGAGAHGRVLLARREPLGEKIVVKEIHADAAGGRDQRRRLLAEMRALTRLDHPNIVRLLDVRAPRRRCLLLIQHVEGRPLDQVLAAGPVRPARVAAWARQILAALGAAHGAGVLHRDIKPSNILIDLHDGVHVTDFGTALLDGGHDRVQATLTNLDARARLVGTLQYMAPEQARGRSAEPSTDLYSVALVLHEALTGRRSPDLRGHGLYEALDLVTRRQVDLRGVPAQWRTVLARALDPDPGRRYGNAAEMATSLAGLDGGSRRRGRDRTPPAT